MNRWFDRIEALPVVRNSPRMSMFWMALMRIMLGLMFLTTWASNLNKGFYTPDGLADFLNGQLNPESLGFYRTFIEEVIIPARTVFAPFQLVSEFLLGLALLTGTFTRPAAVIGFFFILNTYLISIGTGEWPWSYFLIIGLLGAVFFSGAGRSLGVDAWLYKRWGEPKFPLW